MIFKSLHGIGKRKKMRIEYDPVHDLLNIEFISGEPIVAYLL